MVRILMIEDDATVRETVASYLTRAGYSVAVAEDGPSGVEAFTQGPVDVVLLDLMLPGIGGFEVFRRIRAIRRDQPLIMLTARSAEHERVQGLQHGADDYLTKPFSLRELDLRIRSVLRRAATPPPEVAEVIADGDLRIDLAAGSVTKAGEPLNLTARELDLLVWLIQHPGTVHSREDLIREVWHWHAGDDSTVTVHVRRLREKVEANPSTPTRLVTVFGRGYRWDPTPPTGGDA